MAKKKGVLAAVFGGGKKKTGRAAKRPSKPKATKARSSKPAKAKVTQAKPKTKKPTSKTTSGIKNKKTYERPLILVPVDIKSYRDKNGGHPHVIVDNIDNNHISVGLTKDQYKGRNATNYKCSVSPLGDGAQSFMHRQAQVKPKNHYYNHREGKMDLGDFNRAQVYAERAKQKYLQKKSKKK